MTKTSNRTRPLDRDGDGKDGGSLPGNQTAPMVTEAQASETAQVDPGNPNYPDQGEPNSTATPPADAVDDLADVRTMAGDSPEKLEAIERETDEANAAAAAAAAAAADGAGDSDDEDDPHASCDRCAEEHPEGMLEEGLCPSCVDEDEDDALAASTSSDALNAIAEVEPELAAQVVEDHGDTEAYTFDTEQVEAGQNDALNLSLDQVKEALGEVPPSAFRLHELKTLAESRFLYRSAEGYSPTYAAPFISEEVAAQMIAAGLGYFDEDAGNIGALRPTVQARYALAGARRTEAQA